MANQTTVYDIPASCPVSATAIPAPQATPVMAWVTADKAVHVRDKPSEHGLHVRYLYHGGMVQVFECKVTPGPGLWARIAGGWVNAHYLSQNACK